MVAREEIFSFARSFGLAIGVHVLMALLVVLGTMSWKPFRQPQPVGLTIEAVIVDTSEIRKQREAAQKAAAAQEQRRLQQQRRERELAEQRERERQEQQRQKVENEARRKKEAQDKLQQLRLERERKLEEERLKQQRELEQVREQREAAERQRQQEAERLKQIEVRKQKEAAEQKRRVEEAQRAEAEKAAAQQAAEAGRVAGLEDRYRREIQMLVTQNWLRPPTAVAGLECVLRIMQIPGGEVISAAISGRCNGDEATRRSIIAAVERTGTLPYRGYEEVFQREIEFIFIYEGD